MQCVADEGGAISLYNFLAYNFLVYSLAVPLPLFDGLEFLSFFFRDTAIHSLKKCAGRPFSRIPLRPIMPEVINSLSMSLMLSVCAPHTVCHLPVPACSKLLEKGAGRETRWSQLLLRPLFTAPHDAASASLQHLVCSN